MNVLRIFIFGLFKWFILFFVYPFLFSKKSRVRSYIGLKKRAVSQPIIVEKNSKVPKTCTIGHEVYINCNVNIGIGCRSVGSYSSIASDVIISPHTHPVDHFSTCPVFYAKRRGSVQNDLADYQQKDVVIGPDVWIGTRAIILQGVVIGVGAVVGSGAVVTKDVAPYSIVGGIPAKHIRYRFDEDSRKKLIESRWWEQKVENVLKMDLPGKWNA